MSEPKEPMFDPAKTRLIKNVNVLFGLAIAAIAIAAIESAPAAIIIILAAFIFVVYVVQKSLVYASMESAMLGMSFEERLEYKKALDAQRGESRAEKIAELKAKKVAREAQNSLIASNDGQGYMCPVCHGKQFKTKRSGGQKTAIVAGSLVALPVGFLVGGKQKPVFVRCATCGGRFLAPTGPPRAAS